MFLLETKPPKGEIMVRPSFLVFVRLLKEKYARRDLNPQPPVPKTGALSS